MTNEAKRRRRRHAGGATLRDVADHAGVAMMTVSRAINKPATVSPELRDRIAESIRALGYVQNRYAGNLASVSSQLVTVIVPSLSRRVFAEIVHGADEILSPKGYEILVNNTSYSLDDEEDVCRKVLGWRPEGIIICGTDHNPSTRALLRSSGVPVVEALEIGDDPIDINVGLSHEMAGQAIGKYLVERGHRKLGFVGAQMDLDFRAQRRLAGFDREISSHDIDAPMRWLFNEPTSFDLGAKAMAEILDTGPQIDAIFCVNDELAVGGICECNRRGVAIPDDIAVIGFNDLDISAQIVPALTTVRSPRERIGALAAQAILDRVEGRPSGWTTMDVGFELVIRKSA